jgi:hypothetical protein
MSQTTTFAGSAGTAKTEVETSTIRAISWRLIPFLVLAYFFSYLDRVNLGFAALTMNAELKFTPLIFSWGAGIFFIGYFIFEVPSNLALEKFGASRWIARIMVTWGIISALMATVSGVTSFYVLRFLLGVAEAGFFPGIILYLTVLVSGRISRPLPRGLRHCRAGLDRDRRADLGPAARARRRHGPEGLAVAVHHRGHPSVLLGIVTWFYLTDSRRRRTGSRPSRRPGSRQARFRNRGQAGR